MHIESKTGFYYGLAILAAIAALLLREVLGAEFGSHYPYHTAWLAIIFTAWYCGIGPSILTVAMDALGIWYWFLPPYDSLSGKNHVEYFGMLGFLAFSGVIVAMGESNRRLFLRRALAEKALKKANDELEERVMKRTAELERSNESARRLSARVMTVQDEERRRIGRALHDSLGQYLAALKINLDRVEATNESDSKLISESLEFVAQAIVETRTISHLLHPPLLDEVGLCSAIRSFVEGFARRSRLSLTLESFPGSYPRLSPNLEIALFRALQEALTNVHRYANATAVSVCLERNDSCVQLRISDNGKGMSPAVLKEVREGATETGVGIAAMRERIRELNGALQIESGDWGTVLMITAPATLRTDEREPVAIES